MGIGNGRVHGSSLNEDIFVNEYIIMIYCKMNRCNKT